MQLRQSLAFALATLITLSAAGTGYAKDGKKSWLDGMKVGVQLGYFNQVDNGSIPQLDENGSVFQAMLMLDTPLTKEDHITIRAILDVISSASIVRDHNQSWRALQSEATGDVHFDGQVGYRHDDNVWGVGTHVWGSGDFAYQSGAFGADGWVSFFEKDTTLAYSLEGYYASLQMIRFDGHYDPAQTRTTLTQALTLTQVLTPLTVFYLALNYTHQDGFLAGMFNSVFIDGVEAVENLPSTRERGSATVRVKQGIGEDQALELGAREYFDDWGLLAFTAMSTYSLYLFEHMLLIDLGYRYHHQAGLDYYQKSFTADPNRVFQTSDADLAPLDGHQGTLRLTFSNELFSKETSETGGVTVEGDYYTRSNGLDMMWLLLGYRGEF